MIALFLAPFSNNGVSQTTEPRDTAIRELETRINAFFVEFAANPTTLTTKALEDLFKGSPLTTDADTFNTMLKNLSAIPKEFGEPRGGEQIDVRYFDKGRNIVQLRYLFKYDNHPAIWYFIFYRNPNIGTGIAGQVNPWMLISVRFDTNVDSLSFAN